MLQFFFICFFIRLPSEFLPVLWPLTPWCANTLVTALLCCSRAVSDLGLVSRWVKGFVNRVLLPRLGPAVDRDGGNSLGQFVSPICILLSDLSGNSYHLALKAALLWSHLVSPKNAMVSKLACKRDLRRYPDLLIFVLDPTQYYTNQLTLLK